VFVIELLTTSGKVCEGYATYEEARRRVESFPAEALAGVPLIFEELADGSQRLVRDDGKPLQWHRLEDDAPAATDEPIPLVDEASGLLGEGKWVLLDRPRPQDDPDEEPPLRLDDLFPPDPPAPSGSP
jgi:hypothetical protein